MSASNILAEAIPLTLQQAAWFEREGHHREIPDRRGRARVAHTAMHMHASAGIYLDFPMQRYFVAAKRAEFSQGSATAQLRRLGDLLASESASPPGESE